jgi:hypothetical protein
MTKKPASNPNEKRCPACDGTGVLAAIQPVQPGRRIYPAPCGECDGQGTDTKGGQVRRPYRSCETALLRRKILATERGAAPHSIILGPLDVTAYTKKKGRLRCHKRPKSREEMPKEGSDSGGATA